MLALPLITLLGCGSNYSRVVKENLEEANGHDVMLDTQKAVGGDNIKMIIGTKEEGRGFVSGPSIRAEDFDGDGNFDRIDLDGVKKGDKLYDLATFDTLKKIGEIMRRKQ